MKNTKTVSEQFWPHSKFVVLGIVFVLGIITFSIMLVTKNTHERYHEIFLLDDMVHEMQINLYHSHLILEEVAHGDSFYNLDSVFVEFKQLFKTVDAILYGGQTYHGKYMTPQADPELRVELEELKSMLMKLKNASEMRMHTGIESAMDKQYDELFIQTTNKINKQRDRFELHLISYEKKLYYLFWSLLVIWSFIFIIAIISLNKIINQRRKTEFILESSEERYRSLVETAKDAIISIGTSGNIVYWNSGAESIFGHYSYEIIGKHLSIIIPEAFRAAHEDALAVNMEEKFRLYGKTIELAGLRKDGTTFPIELSLSRWSTREGVFFTGIIRDITKRKRNERLLHLSRERYRSIVDDQVEPVCRVSPEGILTFVNNAFCQYMELKRSYLLGKSYLEFIPDHEKDKVENFTKSLNVYNTMRSIELEIITPEHEPRWQKWSIKLIADDQGSIIEYQCVGRDITDRKVVEIELEKYREQLENLVEERTSELNKSCEELARESEVRKEAEDNERSMALFAELNPSPVLRFDIEGRIIMANPAAKDILGKSGLIGKNIVSLIPGTIDINLEACIKGDLIFSHSAQIGGRYYYFIFKGVSDLTAGNIYGSDITDQKNAEADTLRVSQLASLGELAAGVAHEVNNPINGIINFAQILSDRTEEGTREHEAANLIIGEGDRITSIVSSLLSFARPEKDEMNFVYAQEILEESLVLTKAQLQKNGITVIKEISYVLPPIYANYQQIEQVYLNIISNARYALNQKYEGAHKDKILIISMEHIIDDGQAFVKITFKDNGPGISENNLKNVLNPFFSTKASGEGTGLGLSISHGIIRNHGGKIDIESVFGTNTKVILRLPSKEEDESKHTGS